MVKQKQFTVFVNKYPTVMEAKRQVEIMESIGYISTAFAGGWMLELLFVWDGSMP